MHENLYKVDAFTLGKDVIRQAGIYDDIYSSTEPEYLSKQENLEEFINSLREFVETREEEGEPTDMMEFLKDVALLTDRDIEQQNKASVKLMTIHSAKGLEFPCVYVVGMEEDIFPSPQSTDSQRRLEEERRLLYVAITRAEKYCFLTYANMRYRYGKMEFCTPSRFLRDIDRDLLDIGGYSRKTSYSERRQPTTYTTPRNFRPIERPAPSFRHVNTTQPQVSQRTVTTSSPTFLTSNNNAPFNAGDQVIHERFGEGVITAIEGAGDSTKAVVEFAYSGTKKLLLKFAKLKKK